MEEEVTEDRETEEEEVMVEVEETSGDRETPDASTAEKKVISHATAPNLDRNDPEDAITAGKKDIERPNALREEVEVVEEEADEDVTMMEVATTLMPRASSVGRSDTCRGTAIKQEERPVTSVGSRDISQPTARMLRTNPTTSATSADQPSTSWPTARSSMATVRMICPSPSASSATRKDTWRGTVHRTRMEQVVNEEGDEPVTDAETPDTLSETVPKPTKQELTSRSR